MAWTLARTGAATLTLNSSFNLQEYTRETAFTQNELEGSGTVIDAESVHAPATPLTLQGIIKGSDADDARTQLLAIEAVATLDATDLTLANTVTGESYTVQHVSTRAQRRGAAILFTTLTFLTNYTRI